MIDYKKIFKSRRVRMMILSTLSWVPDPLILRLQYYLQTGEKLHLRKPVKFNEFLQAYKLYYRNPLMQRCVDKNEVREYIKEKGLEEALVPKIGIYDSADEIDFDSLPEKFVIKTTDGGGSNEVIVCRDKSWEDFIKIREKVNGWMKSPKPKKHIAREWAYENSYPRRIIIENLLEDEIQKNDIDDFKFFCFNGKFKILEWHKDRSSNHSAAHYDENLKYLPDFYTYENMHADHPLPSNIEEMVSVAEKLASDFPFVRVDLYNVGGKIYFGELTFYPASGYFVYRPEKINTWLGSFFTYPFVSPSK